MSHEARMDALFERLNDQRTYINQLSLERIAWRAGVLSLLRGDEKVDPLGEEIQEIALGFLMGDAEENMGVLGAKIDELKDDDHKKVLKLLFNMIK